MDYDAQQMMPIIVELHVPSNFQYSKGCGLSLNIVRHKYWMFELIVMEAFHTQLTTQNMKLTFWLGGFE